MKRLITVLFAFGLFLVTSGVASAQCAMCRSTIVNNVSNGRELELAAGLNTGILYLFVTPYLLIGIVAFLWYRNAKATKSTGSRSRSLA